MNTTFSVTAGDLVFFPPFSFSPQTYKAFLPAMIANNHGHLVSIASSAGLIGVNGLAGVFFFPKHVMHLSNSKVECVG